MTDKKSFIAYINWKDTFEALPDDKAGLLVKHIFSYAAGENPETDDVLINAVFANIKNALNRDFDKWEGIRVKRSEAGKASADKRKQLQQVSTSVESVQQTSTNPTVNVNVSDSVNGNVSVSESVTVSKKNIEERKQVFILHTSEINFKDNILDDFTLNDDSKGFLPYWTEHGDKDKKMRFEKERSFNTKRRLCTWRDNAAKFSQNKNNNNGQVSTADALSQLINRR